MRTWSEMSHGGGQPPHRNGAIKTNGSFDALLYGIDSIDTTNRYQNGGLIRAPALGIAAPAKGLARGYTSLQHTSFNTDNGLRPPTRPPSAHATAAAVRDPDDDGGNCHAKR
ncbi:hypothetical protein QE152_g30003 [Popillia japonica]|uniref:Uncharacterized protein n=1 Tax=Popillia japonica TaxID=7064 RepID=A0AAW1JG11_POPJA